MFRGIHQCRENACHNCDEQSGYRLLAAGLLNTVDLRRSDGFSAALVGGVELAVGVYLLARSGGPHP
jgi:hypothetical protein